MFLFFKKLFSLSKEKKASSNLMERAMENVLNNGGTQ